ncbi:hypothetical protein P153DRAFT_384462 [Dothidotthia symphoricarpi CBS 119687]|uniref:Uncharacterized protein n=1 Tax=Dothidotthia symphoricarpi CBS 119687 TaxID=1392245 RepID=A0A6A6AGZ2_9PLEO|nr:uncharacterized protein P153DRAFT_384462 [Dothidotthia symphoricarpi CBS 119687]KAF2130184.1 hypothetical protein P153DRAFT_384462 [Dothidotthia symphoricarpi CBS 119687]
MVTRVASHGPRHIPEPMQEFTFLTNLSNDSDQLTEDVSPAPQPVDVVEGLTQDQAIQALLKDGMDQQDIMQCVQAYKKASEGNFLAMIKAISYIPHEALLVRIQAAGTVLEAVSKISDTTPPSQFKRPRPNDINDIPKYTGKRERMDSVYDHPPVIDRSANRTTKRYRLDTGT